VKKVLITLLGLGAMLAMPAVAQTPPLKVIKFGWCAKTVSSAATPFAVATKMGWYEKAGFKVELVPLPGSTDCVKTVATKDVAYSLPSVEPLAIIRPQGVKAKNYYTAYQGNIYGIAVPADSAIKTFTDLKGKKIGVTSMASAGVIVARALATQSGMNPDKDITIVVAGEAAQTAALLRSGQVDALSQFDTQYALTENAGVKLRMLEQPEIAKFPSNGFVALEQTLKDNRAEAIALAQGYAKGSLFAMTNPEAAIRIMWEIWPFTKSTGKDEPTALKDDIKTLDARARNWKHESVGLTKWGENSEVNYQAYVDWLNKNGLLKDKVDAKDLIDNSLIDEINAFDAAAVIAEAKAYVAK
jgi:NitT/TauT family transport system substrate-binding protein